MHYFFEDMSGLAAGTVLAVLLLLLPGFGIARLAARYQLIDDEPLKLACWGLLFGPALLPAADALLLRWLGMTGVLLPHIALAAVGLGPLRETVRRVPGRWWYAVAALWLCVAWTNVDFDWNGRLNQPLTIIDTVKHAAVVNELANRGLPLHDPFFARPGVAGYYFYFYIVPALIHWVGGVVIDARAAFAATTFVTLLAFPAMLIRLAEEALLIPHGRRRRFARVLVLLCCVSGFDLLPGIVITNLSGLTLRQLDSWSVEVRWVLTSILWVPHHMTAVIAVFTGCLLLAQRPPSSVAHRTIVAGAAFATAFGCSVWVAIAAAPVLGLWWIYEQRCRNSAIVSALPLSGVAALVLSLPQFGDVAAGRSFAGFPLGVYVRSFGPIRVESHTIGEALFQLALSPGGYIIEFGIFALGAIVFLMRGGLGKCRSTQIGRLQLVAVPAALLMGTFVRSTVIFNDFGWRSMWFAQVPALLWTTSLLSSRWHRTRSSWIWGAALTLGLAATIWDLAGLRLIRAPRFKVVDSYMNYYPEADYDARGAYRWIDRNLPRQLLVQQNPNIPFRALNFGLYGDRPVPVADVQARLFGADQRAVQARLLMVAPIFTRPMSVAEVQRRGAAAGAGAVIITSADPIWRAEGGPPHDWTCRYRSPHSCIMLLRQTQ
jgi:hypothetical protein